MYTGKASKKGGKAMNTTTRRTAPRNRARDIALVATLVLAISSSHAIAPALLLMIKQIAKQAATSMIKDAVLSGLDGMGCKGMALSNALHAFDLRRAAGGVMTAFAMPPMTVLPGRAPGMSGMPNVSPEVAAKLQSMMPGAGQLPPDVATNPDAMAMMARMQQAMGQPLSPSETLATIDELAELGFLPKAMQAELR